MKYINGVDSADAEFFRRHIIGENIRRLLRDKRRTQMWLAEEIGSTRESISMSISGRATVSLRRMCEIAAALDVPVTELLLDDDDREALRIGREALEDPARADILRILSDIDSETLSHVHYILCMMSHNTTP